MVFQKKCYLREDVFVFLWFFLNFYKDRKNIVWMFYYLPFQRLRKPHQTSNQTLFW